MLGSVYCSVIIFSAWHGVGGACHHGMVQDRLPAFRNGNALVSVDPFKISEADVTTTIQHVDGITVLMV